MEMVKEALDQLRGAVMIVYPMGLPPHDPIRMELEDREDLSGTQVNNWTCLSTPFTSSHWQFIYILFILDHFFLHPSPPIPLHLPSPSVFLPQASLQVITEGECQLWWAGKEMQRGKKLQDYIGKNEKTKLVIKIQKVRVRILWYMSGSVFLWGFGHNNWIITPFVAVPFRKGRGHQRESLCSLRSSRKTWWCITTEDRSSSRLEQVLQKTHFNESCPIFPRSAVLIFLL